VDESSSSTIEPGGSPRRQTRKNPPRTTHALGGDPIAPIRVSSHSRQQDLVRAGDAMMNAGRAFGSRLNRPGMDRGAAAAKREIPAIAPRYRRRMAFTKKSWAETNRVSVRGGVSDPERRASKRHPGISDQRFERSDRWVGSRRPTTGRSDLEVASRPACVPRGELTDAPGHKDTESQIRVLGLGFPATPFISRSGRGALLSRISSMDDEVRIVT